MLPNFKAKSGHYLVGSTVNYLVKTSAAGDVNMFFQGPNMSGLKNYTIQGKMKFDNANAEFGINFYGQWPNQAKKYSVIRNSDNIARLYFTDTTYSTVLQVAEIDSITKNDSLKATNQWYDYKIKISGSNNRIQGWFWKDGDSIPSIPALDKNDSNITTGGLVGFISHSGSGFRYWGPIKVISDSLGTGAYLAYENFKEDTIVDVSPYTPAAMHPIYTTNQFSSSGNPTNFIIDSMGFVLDKKGTGASCTTSLVYRHRPGTVYPVTCQIAPYTNLEWRDYTFTDTIIKPVGSVYDSVDLYVPFYYTDSSNTYQLVFRNDSVLLNGGGISNHLLKNGLKIQGGDTLSINISITTDPVNDNPDSQITINIDIGRNHETRQYFTQTDATQYRKLSGYTCLKVDFNRIGNLGANMSPIKFKGPIIKKIRPNQ